MTGASGHGLAVELARAVAGMHARGVMLRDITPANIVVSELPLTAVGGSVTSR